MRTGNGSVTASCQTVRPVASLTIKVTTNRRQVCCCLKSSSRVSNSDSSYVFMVLRKKALVLFISHHLQEKVTGQPHFLCLASEVTMHVYNGEEGGLRKTKFNTIRTQAKKSKDNCSCGSTASHTDVSMPCDTRGHVLT